MVPVPRLEMSHVIDFVNEYGEGPCSAAGEHTTDYADAVRVLAWPSDAPLPPVDSLLATANAAFEVFSAASERQGAEKLNGMLRSVRPVPVLTEAGLRWTTTAQDDALSAAVATCLLEWLTNHDRARLGTCDAAGCVDVFADASPSGRRRFCSSTCANRHKVAAHRRRASERSR